MKSVNGDRVIVAGAIADAAGACFRPGAIRLRGRMVVATGPPEDVLSAGSGEASVEELPNRLVMPGLVNAHTHLDLTHIGPVEYGGDFVGWVEAVARRRVADYEAIHRAVEVGIAASLAGGTSIVGDIAGMGSRVPLRALREAASRTAPNLRGVSFVEFFGLGQRQAAAVATMRAVAEAEGQCFDAGSEVVRLGLQPHAPYSAGLDVYREAARHGAERGVPVCTHLAETRGEIEFTQYGRGPEADFVRRIGKWDASIVPSGLHPIDHLADILAGPARWLVAHANYAEDEHLDLLARTRTSVVYCPRASAYFGHRGHRYREMLAQGVNVALGTDSILCLDTPRRLSVLDEMSLLFRRDGTDPYALLRMATVNGAKALGFDPRLVTLARKSEIAGLIALPFDPTDPTDPLEHVLGQAYPVPIETVGLGKC